MPSQPTASDRIAGLYRAEPGSLALLRDWCREPIARPETLALDQPTNIRDDLFGAALRAAFRAFAPDSAGRHSGLSNHTCRVAHQNVKRSPSWMSCGLLRSWLMNPNVEFRGLISGFQSTV